MKTKEKKILVLGSILITAFVIWTVLVMKVDVQPVGVNGTCVGFAGINLWFHQCTGVNMNLYVITDWLGLVPAFVCVMFGGMGLIQLINHRSLFKVDRDLICLGIYYVIVILCYLVFEEIPINYRPILIEGVMEVSYPSSTTLLVLSVMPTLMEQMSRRLKNDIVKRFLCILTIGFSVFMVVGRLISGVHWLTDIVGSVLFSMGLFCIYRAIVLLCKKE